jgi:hypothetical protein
MNNASYEAPHYAVFFSLIYFSSAPCTENSSLYFLPLIFWIKFHSHARQWAELWFYYFFIFTFLDIICEGIPNWSVAGIPRFLSLCLCSEVQASAASMKLSVSLQLLDLGQSIGLLGRVISSSQGLYLYTNTEKRTYNTNTKHPCPEWNSNPRSRRPRERRKFMP